MLSEINDKEEKEKPEHMVSGLSINSDFINLLNSLQSILSNIPIISLWPISLSLKLKG